MIGDRPPFPTPAMQYLAVITNVATKPEAQELAQKIVAKNLAACAQISEIESFYHWDGKIQHDTEFRILFKTTTECYPAIAVAIQAIHPYELPPIHAVVLDHVESIYGKWIDCHTSKQS